MRDSLVSSLVTDSMTNGGSNSVAVRELNVINTLYYPLSQSLGYAALPYTDSMNHAYIQKSKAPHSPGNRHCHKTTSAG
nr:hypothetical protein SUGSMm_15000 [Morganella morganii subsp. sibonii]